MNEKHHLRKYAKNVRITVISHKEKLYLISLIFLLLILLAVTLNLVWILPVYKRGTESRVEQALPITNTSTTTQVLGDSRDMPFNGLLKNVKDYTPFEEDKAYYELLYSLSMYKTNDIEEKSMSLSCKDIKEKSVFLRGGFVKVRGILILFRRIKLAEGNYSGVELAYEGILLDEKDGEPCYFNVISNDKKIPKDSLSRVEISGIYYKIITYQGSTGKMISAPFIVGKDIVELEEKKLGWGKSATYCVILAVIGGIVLFLLFRLLAKMSHENFKRRIRLMEDRLRNKNTET